MIYKLKEYFENFSGFDESKVTVDYENFEKNTVVLRPCAFDPVVKRYQDGGEIRQYIFTINFKTDYRIKDNSAYYLEKLLKDYINENPIDGGLYFEVLESCHLKKVSASVAEYEMKLRYVYERNE